MTNTRHPAATLALMATEDPRTPRPRHTPTPKSERPRCDDPDCSNAAYVLAHDNHRYCPSCFHRRTAVWRRENRTRGRCACGQEPTKDYKTCHRCRSRSALRIRRWRLRQQYGPPTHGWYTIGARAGSVTPSRAKQRASSEDSRHHPVIDSGLPGHAEPREARAPLVEAMIDPNQILYELACIAYADITLLYDAQGTLLPMQDWPDEMRPAVRSVKLRVQLTADGALEEVWDVRLWDKHRALKLLGTHLGLFEKKGQDDPGVDIVPILQAGRARVARGLSSVKSDLDAGLRGNDRTG